MNPFKLNAIQINALALVAETGWVGHFSADTKDVLPRCGFVAEGQITDAGRDFLASYLIEHELAHRLADVACGAGDYAHALELLERANRDGSIGFHSSIRTANRIVNMKERLQ